MKKIGITGGIGSGKTIVCKIFEILGIPHFNADQEAKKIMEQDEYTKNILKKTFGKDIYSGEKLLRAKLSEIIFNDPAALKTINNIIHPKVKSLFIQWSENKINAPYIIAEAAILFESRFDELLDEVIGISCPESLRIKRLLERDGINIDDIKKRMANQMPEDEKINRCDRVIYNHQHELVLPQILSIHSSLTQNKRNNNEKIC
ncbi:MAG: dephospho-CoA kinase [Bacteroidota bacterium]